MKQNILKKLIKKDDAEKPDYFKKEIYCYYYYQIDFKPTEAYKNTTYNEI